MDPQPSSQSTTPTIIHGVTRSGPRPRMPRIVRVVRVLTVLELIALAGAALGIVAIPGLATTAIGKNFGGSGAPLAIAIALVVCTAHFAFNFWMYRAMGAGTTAVWYVEVVCDVVGVLSLLQVFLKHSNVPCPMLQAGMYCAILAYWLKPETKRYFNVR